ncbi:MAG: YraN family protein [Anaerolineaceae bacterium]|nr:YraN family protein [Anaerolineaceae bacterium]
MGFLQKHELGRWGEQTANDFLAQQGVKILAKNYRSRYGEIDLIGWDGDSLVFFEVKTRQSLHFGSPDQAVAGDKIKHIINTALIYISTYYHQEPLWRIDIISINRNPKSNSYDVQWIKNAAA